MRTYWTAVRRSYPGLWLVALASLALLAVASQNRLPEGAAVGLGILLVGLTTIMLVRGRYDAAGSTAGAPGPWKGALTLLAKMSPTVLLMATFPLVITTINSTSIAGVPAGQVLLAISVSVPWLSQAVCVAFYRHFWDLKDQRATNQVAERIFARWPEIILATLPVSAFFTAVIAVVTQWPPFVLLCVGIGMLLNSLFAQSQVLINQTRNDGLWVVSWALYTLVVIVAPQLWLLAPVVGMIPNVVIIAVRGRGFHRPTLREMVEHLTDTWRGFLTGSVLWADKFVLLLMAGTLVDILNLYIALIPAMLAYAYYFAQLAPNFDLAVAKADGSIQKGSIDELRRRSAQVSDVVAHAVARTVAIAAVSALALVIILEIVDWQPVEPALIIVQIGSLVIAILAYQLEYIGHRAFAGALAGLHLISVMSLTVLPLPTATALIIAADVVLAIIGYARMRQVWGSVAYQMFWRFATQW